MRKEAGSGREKARKIDPKKGAENLSELRTENGQTPLPGIPVM
jgi:hypothetical protein